MWPPPVLIPGMRRPVPHRPGRCAGPPANRPLGAEMFVELNGVTHHYVSKGEGPPVVLLHGLGGSLHTLYGVIEALANHHHVVAMDLRGFGRSGSGNGGFSIQQWSQDVVALIGALELPPVT